MDDQGRPPRVEEADKAPLTTAYVQHSSQAKRMRTMGQSESPHPTPPRGRNPSPYLDVAANQQTRPALCSMSSVLIMRSSHHAELTGLLPGLSFSSSSRA